MYINNKAIILSCIFLVFLSCTPSDVKIIVMDHLLVEEVDKSGRLTQKVSIYIENNLLDTVILRLVQENEIADIQSLQGRIVDCRIEGVNIRGSIDYSLYKIDTLLPGRRKYISLQLSSFSLPSQNCGISFATIGYELIKDDRLHPYNNNYKYAQIPIIRSSTGEISVSETLRGYDEKSLPRIDGLEKIIDIENLCESC